MASTPAPRSTRFVGFGRSVRSVCLVRSIRLVRGVRFVTFALAGLAGASAALAQNCGPGQLAAALNSAPPGSTVRMGQCTLAGPFKVPAGVHLRGSGPGASIIVAPPQGVGVTLSGSSGWAYTTLSELRVASDGNFGVRITGGRDAWVRDVVVNVSRGAGIVAENLPGQVELDRVVVLGPVTCANAASLHGALGDVTGSHGIVMKDVGTVRLDRAVASRFSQFGALFVNSHVTWTGGGGSGSIEANAALHGGTAQLDSLAFVGDQGPECLVGQQGPEMSVGLAFLAGVNARTFNLNVSGNPHLGIFTDGASRVSAQGPQFMRNGLAGLWCQNGAVCAVDGALLNHNGLAGIVMVDAAQALITRSVVANTQTASHPATGSAGDGITLVRTPAQLGGLTLANNERAGVAVALAGDQGPQAIVFNRVNVGGSGQFGVVAQQNGVPLPAYTAGIQRSAKLAVADAAFALGGNPLSVFGNVLPCAMPAAQAVALYGLAAIFGGGFDPFPTE